MSSRHRKGVRASPGSTAYAAESLQASGKRWKKRRPEPSSGGAASFLHFVVIVNTSVGQLRKRHAQVLIEAGKALDLVFGLVPMDAALEGVQRKMVHQLREDELACVHRSPRREGDAQGRRMHQPRSSR